MSNKENTPVVEGTETPEVETAQEVIKPAKAPKSTKTEREITIKKEMETLKKKSKLKDEQITVEDEDSNFFGPLLGGSKIVNVKEKERDARKIEKEMEKLDT